MVREAAKPAVSAAEVSSNSSKNFSLVARVAEAVPVAAAAEAPVRLEVVAAAAAKAARAVKVAHVVAAKAVASK